VSRNALVHRFRFMLIIGLENTVKYKGNIDKCGYDILF